MINKIKVITIGKIKERYLIEGINEFKKRLQRFCNMEIVELKDLGLEKEAEKILPYIKSKTFVLDAKGKSFSSEEFAELLKKEEGEIAFVIGGPEGISEKIKRNANLISLSKMTFLHEMARLILLEQIYRAYTIIHRMPYHK